MADQCVVNLGDGSLLAGDSDIRNNTQLQDVTNNNSTQSNTETAYTGKVECQNNIPSPGSKLVNDQEVNKPSRLYFKKGDENSTDTNFECITEYCQPLVVDASKRFTQWSGNNKGLKPGFYNIVLGVSIEELNVSNIESISFCNKNTSIIESGPLETYKTFPKPGSEVLRWGLHHQYQVDSRPECKNLVDMEIRTRQLSQSHPGFIHLHYMELHAFQLDPSTDPSLNIHRPYIWSIDVGTNESQSNIGTPAKPAKIISYSLSGDGTHVVTLSSTTEQLQLDVWDLRSDEMMTKSLDGESLSGVNLSRLIVPSTPYNPRHSGQILLPLPKSFLSAAEPITVSLSWDASKVSLVSDAEKYLKESFRIYNMDTAARFRKEKTSGSRPPDTLTPLEFSQLHPKLKEFEGHGRFHMIDDYNPDPKDQLFITTCKASLDIYSAHEQWTHLRTISQESMVHPHHTLRSVRSKYFSCSTQQGSIYICDLETGLIVSRLSLSRGAFVRFSRNGSQMCVRSEIKLSSCWTESGTIINTTDCMIGEASFFQNDSQLIINKVVPEEAYGRGIQAEILNTADMSTVHKISADIPKNMQQLQSYGRNARSVLTLRGSKLDLVRLDDIIVKPYSQPRYSCDNGCFNELTSLRYIDIQSINEGSNKFILDSGLKLRVEMRATSTEGLRSDSDRLQSLVIWMSDSTGKEREALIIPPNDLGNILSEWLEYRVSFNALTSQLIVRSHLVLMVWGMPSTLEGSFTLLSTSWTQQCPYQTENRSDFLLTKISTCTHGETYLQLLTWDEYYEDVVVDKIRLLYENIFIEEPSRSLDGALVLVELFNGAEGNFRQAIIQYIGRYINCYSNPEDLSENVLARICQNVSQDNHNIYHRFLTALFESSHCRWVPRCDYNEKTNPISILLKLSEKAPTAIELAHTIISYCIHQSNQTKDPYFAQTLLEPLHDLIDQKQIHRDLTLGTLRRLAFTPIKERAFIIDHHRIAYPPSWWKFWADNKQPIYECENPVWQIDRHPLPELKSSLNDNFTRDIFVATFDMLWRTSKKVTDARSVVARISSPTHTPQSWVRTLIYIALLRCKLVPESGLEVHDFALESFDNPAIIALIEYKWNTIGYVYWLFRFCWQCIYYILVLSAVFIQVYSDARDSIVGIFVAIIVLALIFLWLEVIQMSRSASQYFTSPYNYVDLVVYTLPLVGSALQIVNVVTLQQGNTSTLSFSVLFIFLHFLFELRINRGVCHFVTIIVRIIGEIQVFFFVFAGGLVAFTIAILHLLRACPVGTCDTSQVGFPSNFYSAFSSTYFFMGGIWDPISDNFSTDDWVFHTMMIIYFFFTTILLLNVLISLINVAFSAGDETWLLVWAENRLRYVESAESMTYHIPGFREAHDWFPKEIYYSATVQEVNDYRARCFKKDGQDFIRSDAATQRLFGQTSPAKKVIEASVNNTNNINENSDNCNCNCNHRNRPAFILPQSSSTTLAQDASELDNPLMASTDQQQQQTAQDLQDLKAQLAEMKRMLSLLCKEKVDEKEE